MNADAGRPNVDGWLNVDSGRLKLDAGWPPNVDGWLKVGVCSVKVDAGRLNVDAG